MSKAPSTQRRGACTAPRERDGSVATDEEGNTALPSHVRRHRTGPLSRQSAPLSAAGLHVWGFERYLQAALIQHWLPLYSRIGNEKLARRLNRCMNCQTNEERVRRLRADLPSEGPPLHAPRKPPKHYRRRFPVMIAEDCLWPLLEEEQ